MQVGDHSGLERGAGPAIRARDVAPALQLDRAEVDEVAELAAEAPEVERARPGDSAVEVAPGRGVEESGLDRQPLDGPCVLRARQPRRSRFLEREGAVAVPRPEVRDLGLDVPGLRRRIRSAPRPGSRPSPDRARSPCGGGERAAVGPPARRGRACRPAGSVPPGGAGSVPSARIEPSGEVSSRRRICQASAASARFHTPTTQLSRRWSPASPGPAASRPSSQALPQRSQPPRPASDGKFAVERPPGRPPLAIDAQGHRRPATSTARSAGAPPAAAASGRTGP